MIWTSIIHAKKPLPIKEDLYQESFTIITYNDWNTLIDELRNHEDILKVENIYFKYPDIPTPKCLEQQEPCQSYFIEMAPFEKGPEYIQKLPTVFLVAGFHGNEIIGTQTMYYFFKNLISNEYLLDKYKKIIDNTRILFLPTANPQGFSLLQREENLQDQSNDPNRDFPYNIGTGSCFQTSISLVIDKIFRDNLIVGSLTFHGGDNSISYPWGNFAHQDDPLTGDQIAFQYVAQILQESAANGNQKKNIPDYEIGNLQSTVYDVYGGYEDWAYGASWDTTNVPKQCSNEKKHEQIQYNDSTNRALVFLVETGYQKIPDSITLGNQLSLYYPKDDNAVYGHIARNINLITTFSELMKPYLILDEIKMDQEDLVINFQIRGCQFLEFVSFDVQNTSYTQNKISSQNYFNIRVQIKTPDQSFNSLLISYQCGKEYTEQYQNLNAETHFVRMRKNADYKAQNGDFNLSSIKILSTQLYNIKIPQLKNAIPFYSNSQEIALVYSKNYTLSTPQKKITLIVDNELVKLQEKIEGDILQPLYLPVKKERNLLLSISQNKVDVQDLLECVGKPLIYIENKKNNISYIELEKYDFLLVPVQGLYALSQTINEITYFSIKRINNKIYIQIFSSQSLGFKIKLQGIEFIVDELIFNQQEDKYEFSYQSKELSIQEQRLFGSFLTIYSLETNEVINELRLLVQNPYENLEETLPFKIFMDQKEIIIREKNRIVQYMILGMMIGLCLGVCIIKCSIKQEEMEEMKIMKEIVVDQIDQ